MTVLILDDQPHVITGLMLGIHWKLCGVNRILKATDAEEVRRRMKSTVVDILLCDIEMPVENGLDFIKWLRDEHYETECIMLTAHANFDYAKRALQLGSIDYILQPAPYETIEKALIEAQKHIHVRNEEKRYSTYGQLLWGKHEQLSKLLVDDWFNGRYADEASLRQDLESLELGIDENSRFLCAVCLFGHSSDNNQILLESALTEITDSIDIKILVATLDKQEFRITVLTQHMDEDARLQLSMEALKTYIQASYSLSVNFVCSKSLCTMQSVADDMEDLRESLQLSIESTVTDASQQAATSKILPPLEICCELRRQLDSAGPTMTTDAYRKLYYDFLQSLSASLHNCNLSLRDLMGDNMERLMSAFHAPSELSSCLDYAIATLSGRSLEVENPQEQLNAIIAYIHQNIEKDIRRSDVAGAVYLSSSYLSRFFKERMNITLKDFIIQEKMKLARTLLSSTQLPVSVIATKVGYTNFSYFSQTYKRIWNVTPSAERDETTE